MSKKKIRERRTRANMREVKNEDQRKNGMKENKCKFTNETDLAKKHRERKKYE